MKANIKKYVAFNISLSKPYINKSKYMLTENTFFLLW